MAEKNFVEGMRVSRRQTAPAYILANLGIKVDDFRKWLDRNQTGEWMNIDIKLSKNGNYYAELNTYNKADEIRKANEPEENQSKLNNLDSEPVIEYPSEEINIEDIPF